MIHYTHGNETMKKEKVHIMGRPASDRRNRLNVRISEELRAQFRVYCEKSGKSMSDTLREYIEREISSTA